VPRSLAVAALVACSPFAWFGAAKLGAAELPHARPSWLKLSTANFELYTTADEGTGRGLILQLESLRAVLQPILGWRGEPRGDPRDQRARPICIIAFGSRDEFQPYSPVSRSTGFFLPGTRRDFVVLDGSRAESRAASHEYVHFVTANSGLRLPPWLNEGIAELYSNLQVPRSGERTEIGRFIPGRVLAQRQDAWIGLDRLTSAGADSEVFTEADSVDGAYAESWLLAHMLVLDPRYEAKFPDLVAALQTTETAASFRQVYGKSTADVERDLKAYLESGQMNARILGEPPTPAALRILVEHDADFDGRSAVAEMLGNYRGRSEQSRDLYRQLGRDYPSRAGPR
jgi:hypothetical protein